MKKYKRSRLEIFNNILCCLDSINGTKKTHILYKANLSHQNMFDYIKELENKEFIIYRTNKYFLTAKGNVFKWNVKNLINFKEKTEKEFNIIL